MASFNYIVLLCLGRNLHSEAYSTAAIVFNSTETVGSKAEVNCFETKAELET